MNEHTTAELSDHTMAVFLAQEVATLTTKLEAAEATITALEAEKAELVKVETLAMLLCNEYFRSTSDIGPSMEKLYELLKQEKVGLSTPKELWKARSDSAVIITKQEQKP